MTERYSTAEQHSTAEAIDSIHIPVLLDECVRLVTGVHAESPTQQAPSKVIVDCTLGLAGHTQAFLQRDANAYVIGIDRDLNALDLAVARLGENSTNDKRLPDRFTPVHASFDQFEQVLADCGISKVDTVFMDLGLSSLQIDDIERGFSYSTDSPLDMRMDTSTQRLTAADILNTYSEARLTDIFKEYGEEKFARLIASRILEQRENTLFEHSAQLVELVDACVPRAKRPAGNPAKRVFQALRIEVNGELDQLAATLPVIALHLKPHGRIVVESYHSLEDKIVKRFFNTGLVTDVPPGLPIIPEGQQSFFADLTHGAIKASELEAQRNPRSQSVRLRAVELIRPIPRRWVNRYSQHGQYSQHTNESHTNHHQRERRD